MIDRPIRNAAHVGILAAILVLAMRPAHAQFQPGGLAPVAGGSIGSNPDQRSGPYPSPGDSSAGNTISSGGTLGYGQATPQAVFSGPNSDTAVGPAAGAPRKAPPAQAPGRQN